MIRYRGEESEERAVTTLKKLLIIHMMKSTSSLPGKPKPPVPRSPAAALQPLSPPGHLNLAFWPGHERGSRAEGLNPIFGTPLGSLSNTHVRLCSYQLLLQPSLGKPATSPLGEADQGGCNASKHANLKA